MSELYKKVQEIQTHLKVPKNLYNSFGKYKYRNAEGICEAVKPLLAEHGLILTLSDELVAVGERYYVKATATIRSDVEEKLSVSAFARESFDKKGMDDSQITGTASSYARKYALNGLFLLDDTKDADTDEYSNENNRKMEIVSKEQLEELKQLCKEADREESYIAKSMGVKTLAELPAEKFNKVRKGLVDIKMKGAKG